MKKSILLLNFFLLCILLSSSFLTGCNCNGSPETYQPAAIESITTGAPVKVASQTVKTGGATITVDKPDSPIDGLVVEVPGGSYNRDTEFDISYSTIEKHIFGDEVKSLSPLISIENGGKYSDEYMTVTIPADIPEDYFAMAFYYDEETGDIEGIPTLDYDSESLTLVTKHFSLFTLFAVEKKVLENLDIDTDFKQGVDDWNLVNAGSYMEPGGLCRGMCLSSIWYYLKEKPATGEPLWTKNDNGLGKGKETPNFWKDDRWAIRFNSAVQVNTSNLTDSTINDYVIKEYGFHSTKTPNRVSFYSLAFAMYLSEKLHEEDNTRIISPQVIGVYSPVSGTNKVIGHIIVCYKLKGKVLYVADPNMPGKANPYTPTITYDDKNELGDGVFSNYSSAQNATDILMGNFIIYSAVRFRGVSSFDDMQKIGEMWLESENGRCLTDNVSERCFPEYSLYLKLKDNTGKTVEEELDVMNGTTVSQESFGLALEGPFKDARAEVYDFDKVMEYEKAKQKDPDVKMPSPVDLAKYKLKEGDNLLGFCVIALTGERKTKDGKTVKEWSWSGFDWVNIRYKPQEVVEVAVDLSKVTACSIRLDNIDATMKLPDGQTDTITISPTQSNTGSLWGEGSFSGNTFTATWEERECGSSCVCSGSISITIDPATLDIIGFSMNMDTNDKWQPDWVIEMESNPGITIDTDLEFFQKHDSSKLTYRVFKDEVCETINLDNFVYKWTPGGDQWRECVGWGCNDDTLLTITFAVEE